MWCRTPIQYLYAGNVGDLKSNSSFTVVCCVSEWETWLGSSEQAVPSTQSALGAEKNFPRAMANIGCGKPPDDAAYIKSVLSSKLCLRWIFFFSLSNSSALQTMRYIVALRPFLIGECFLELDKRSLLSLHIASVNRQHKRGKRPQRKHVTLNLDTVGFAREQWHTANKKTSRSPLSLL